MEYFTLRSICVATCAVLIFTISTVHAVAQINTTPGLPWTYVVEDSIPSYAIDTAYEQSIYDLYESFGDPDRYEIRYLFRINCHPELAEVNDLDQVLIEVPRNPGSSELLALEGGRAEIRSIRVGNDTFDVGYSVSGFRNSLRPELALASLNFSEYDGTTDPNDPSPDTTYSGRLKFAPDYYEIFPNIRGPHDSYAYFIQFVDSVWHPRVSSIPQGFVPLPVSVYPNPTLGPFRLEVPASWSLSPVTVRIYDQQGKLILRKRCAPNAIHDLELPWDSPPGIYPVAVYRDGGEYAIGQVVKQ